jgi:hypothetical protein
MRPLQRARASGIAFGLFVAATTFGSRALAQDAQGVNSNCNATPQVTNQGTGSRPGPATLVPILWGWDTGDPIVEAEAVVDQSRYDHVYAEIEQSNYYHWLQLEYGAPSLQHVFPQQAFATLTSSTFDDASIKNALSDWIRGGYAPNVPNSVYVVHLPTGVTVPNTEVTCPNPGAYNAVRLTFNLLHGGAIGFYYIVVPSPGTCGATFDTLTVSLSHEIAESVTDGAYFNWNANLHGWEDPAQPAACGTQLADLCVGEWTTIQSAGQFGRGGPYPPLTVQKLWSNQMKACVTEDLSTIPTITSAIAPVTVTDNGQTIPTGNPGTTVTLTGTNLEGTPTVHFGSVPAVATCSSPTQCTVVAPPGVAGLVPLTFTEDNTTLSIGSYDYLPTGPACTASTDCGGTVYVSCTGPNAWILPEGQYAELTVYPSTPTSASSRWIASNTSPNDFEACTTDGIASSCVQMSTSAPTTGCSGNGGPPPRCNSGYVFCPRYNECVPEKECLIQKN